MNIQSNQNDSDKEEEAMAQGRQSVSLAPAGLDSESASTFQCVPESTQEQGQCAKLPETIPGVLTDSIQPGLKGTKPRHRLLRSCFAGRLAAWHALVCMVSE